MVRSRPRRPPSCLQNTTTLYRHLTAAGSWEQYDHGHDGPPRVCRIQLHCTDTLQLQVLGSGTITATTAPLVFVEYNYIVPTPYSCRFLGVVRSRPRRPPSCLQNTTTLYRHLTAAGSWEQYDHGHDGPPRVCRIQLHCTDTLQIQVLGSSTITATTAPLVFVEYNYIVPTPYSCRFLGVVRSRPRRPPSCLQNTTTLYRHLTAAGSWEQYDHGHDGPPRVCRIQLHCTDTLQLQVLGSSTITATTAPLVFVEYNYIVPTPYSCRFLGVVRSRPRRPPSCLQNTTTLYPHLTAAGSWEQYDHGHDGPPRVCRIQLHCTDTLQLQVLGSSTITATTAPLVFVEYNYIVPTPYSCRFLGVVRSRPRRPPSCLQNTTTLYRHLTAAGSWEQYDHGHDGPPRVCRIQLHCTDTLQLQVLGSSTITATTAPLVFVEYNYIVPTPYSSRFLGVVRSRPRRPPSCLQNTTTLYRHLTAAGSWEWYDHGHDGPPRVCRIQLHCTDTLQLQVLGSSTITATTAPLVFVEYNYIVPTPYSCRFLGVVRSRPRRPPSCLQNTTTLYRHLTAAGSWEQYDHGHDGPPRVCRIQLHCTDTLQLQVLGSSTITATTAPLVFVEYNYIVPTPYSCRFLGVVRSRPRRPPSCLQNTTTLYRHRFLGVVRSRPRRPPSCLQNITTLYRHLLQVLGSSTITATTAPLVFVEYNYIVPTPYSCRFLGVVRSRPRRPPSCLQNTTTLYRHLTAAGSWEQYDHGHDGPPRVCRIQLHCTDTLQLQVLGSSTITATTAPLVFVEYNYIVPTPYSCRFLGVVRSRPRRPPSCLQNTTTLYRHLTAAGSWEQYDHGHDGPPRVCRIQLHCTDTLQLQVLGSSTITATTAPLVFVEYNYIVPTPYSCRFLGVVRSRPRRPPSCLQNTTTLYRHLTAAGSWEQYDHGHDGPPRVCRIQLHCTDTLQLQVLGSSTITATTAPLVFVEYNYIVPTPYSCRFLGMVRSRPRRPPSCLQNTTTLYPHLTDLQVLGSSTITATTAPLVFVEYNYIVPTPYSCRFLGVVRSRPRRPPSCLQNITTLYRHLTAAGSWEQYDHGHDGPPRVCRIQLHCTDTLQLQVLGSSTITATTAPSCLQGQLQVLGSSTITATTAPLVFVEYNYIVPTPYSCRFLGVVRSRPRRPPSCLQNTTTLYRHLTAAGSWEQYDHGHDGPPRVCRIQLHCTDTLQLQVLGSGTITATTAPLVFVEYNYIVPTPYSCRFLGVVRSRPRRPPSCLQNTTTLYRHLTAAGSWEQYDHGHDGPPRVCRIQLHCTDTLQLQVLGSSTITATTAPLVFVEYNYIVPTPYSCRFLGVVRSRPRRPPSCLQNTTTLYRHLTAAGSWEQYDHGHDGPPRVCRIQLHCTDTLQLQVLGSSTITATTAPLVFVEYNQTPYSCRFLGVVRSRPRRGPLVFVEQLHCTDTLQLQVLGSSTITATTAPLVFVEYNYIVPTPYSCRFLGVVRSRPRRPPSCLQNTTTLYRHLTAAGSWEQYDHGHDGPPRVCRIQLHCTDTLQLQVLGSSTITATTAPLVFVEYNYIVPTPYTGSWEQYDHGHDGPPQNTTTLYRHLTAAGSWEQYDHGHDGPPRVCRIQLHCTDTLQLQVLGSSTITATTAPLVFVEYNYIVPTPYSCRFLGVVRSRPRRPPSCLQNITTLYRHLTDPGSWEQYDHGHDGPPRVCRIQLHCTDTLQLQVLGNGTITATTAPLVFVEYNYIVPTPYSCRFLGVVRSRPRRPPSCLQNTTTLYRHLTAAGSWEQYDHGHDGPPRVCRI